MRRIIDAIADAAARWRDADFPPRVRALARIKDRTGYSEPVVEYALDRLFGAVTADALESTIACELGSLDMLDRWTPVGGSQRKARPAGRIAIISSRTTIGVAIVPALFAICAKCSVVVKDREDYFVASFFETLSEELDELGGSENTLVSVARAEAWNGESGDASDVSTADLSTYDVVVAFGGNAALQAIRAQLAPAARFIPYGPKASIGYVGRGALVDETSARQIVEGAARDFLLYDGEGCLSLHALFVERGGGVSFEPFCQSLAQEIRRVAVEFPPSDRDAPTVARVTSARDLAVFRARGAVYSDPSASYVLDTAGRLEEPPLFLPRVLAVMAIDEPAQMLEYVKRHRLPLEACAVAGSRDDIEAAALDAGTNRITCFGELQNPPLEYAHGGRPRIAEFVRFVTKRQA